ncbi:glycosyltransferase [Bradyrhizobium sp. 187]|uniref:glycosyltransferase family protein n=1 Tax=Bradyrhizobium sp. 187 TaxID=2782655 RepID=UPI001FFE5ADA|nr:glycosyltransferase [Bradyrhizobium sp. 187]UPJ70907.1 glycosyltransferase family 1 protein [Bradyrhizobium sp. 187]
MRVFQNCGLTPSYLARLDRLAPEGLSFQERRNTFLDDRFGALHLLQPVLAGDASAFLTCANDGRLQGRWACEHGVRRGATPEDILLAQIEHHRTEVLYNLDPVAFPSSFVRRLPGCVRKTLCWRAAPSGNADLTAYGAVLGNFPSILDSWRDKGCRAEWFSPAIDPVMSDYVQDERPIDVLFVGGYSRHHSARARTLEKVAALAGSRKIVYCLDSSRLTRIAESSIGYLLPLQKYRRPRIVAAIAKPPVFGRELYELIGRSKIVLNGAIDMAGQDRGNMRCFEAMGCGALLVSDAGNYPEGMIAEDTMLAYRNEKSCLEQIERAISDWSAVRQIAMNGRIRVDEIHTKARQWSLFQAIVASL